MLQSAVSVDQPRLSTEHWLGDNTEDWIFEEPLDLWTVEDVQEWLYSIEMDEHAQQFEVGSPSPSCMCGGLAIITLLASM